MLVVVVVVGVFAPSTRELLFMYFYVKTVPERPSHRVHKMLNPERSFAETMFIWFLFFHVGTPFGPAESKRSELRTCPLGLGFPNFPCAFVPGSTRGDPSGLVPGGAKRTDYRLK